MNHTRKRRKPNCNNLLSQQRQQQHLEELERKKEHGHPMFNEGDPCCMENILPSRSNNNNNNDNNANANHHCHNQQSARNKNWRLNYHSKQQQSNVNSSSMNSINNRYNNTSHRGNKKIFDIARKLSRGVIFLNKSNKKNKYFATNNREKNRLPSSSSSSCIRYAIITIVMLLLFVICMIMIVFHGFIRDAKQLCQRPSSNNNKESSSSSSSTYHHHKNNKPLVEYYIHGHGYGHYSRSIGIIEVLNNRGYDVRMFISRSKMWEEFHFHHFGADHNANSNSSPSTNFLSASASTYSNEKLCHIWVENCLMKNCSDFSSNSTTNDKKHINNKRIKNPTISASTKKRNKGSTTAISVSSILPNYSIISALSHITERIIGDCEVAAQTKRYPIIVISDGDVPGILRAKLGSIPSISISHGNIFAIVSNPALSAYAISSSSRILKAWKVQSKLNSRFTFLSDWQIGTHYFDLVSSFSSRSSRSKNKNNSNRLSFMNNRAIIVPPRMRNDIVKVNYARYRRKMKGKSLILRNSNNDSNVDNRPMILCYFRDKNGQFIIETLLKKGFNVIHMLSSAKNAGPQWVSSSNEKNKDDVSSTLPKYKFNNDNNKKPKLIQITDPSLFLPIMSFVDGVVSSAGSNIINECYYLKIPFFALHLLNDTEQMLNVELIHWYNNDNDSSNKNENDKDGVKTYLFGSSFESMHNYFSTVGNSNHDERMDDNNVDTSNTTNAARMMNQFLRKNDNNNHRQKKYNQEHERMKYDMDNFFDMVHDSKISQVYFHEMINKLNDVYNDPKSSRISKVNDDDDNDKNDLLLLDEEDQNEKESKNDYIDAADVILDIIKQLDY